MGASGRVGFVRLSAIFALAFLPLPATFAGGPANKGVSPETRPARQVKVWTNDDLSKLGPPLETAGQGTTGAGAAQPPAQNGSREPVVGATPLNPQQDPQWYALQESALEQELVAVESREEALRNFQATDSGLPVGLNVVAPCEGVGTDNLIAQLEARRQEIVEQMDTLADTARENDMAPGVLEEGITSGPAPTPSQLRADLLAQYNGVSNELAQTRDTILAMETDAGAQGITLSQPVAGEGGNLTTNLQQDLDNRAAALQEQASALQDAAIEAGVEPSQLR